MTIAGARARAALPAILLAAIILACPPPVADLLPGLRMHAAQPAAAPQGKDRLTDSQRDHWAFKPLARPDPPAVRDTAWVNNPIDRFILARLEEQQLAPTPPANRAALIRRAALDLTGLPPTPAEVAAFVADRSPDAWPKVLDRLLASPAYGQRWAQHWLDLASYADTDGFEHDQVRPEAWRYRDWVIDALNSDMPYDEFVRLQIAGDRLRPGDQQAAVATGFLLSGPDMPDINLQEERRHTVLNDITGNVGAVLLGLQIACAQCHDHKFDPISQADFYRLRAVFETAQLFKPHPFGRVLWENNEKPAPSYVMVRGDFRRPGAQVQPAFPPIANPWGDQVRTPDAPGSRRVALAAWLTRADHPLVTRVLVNRLWQHHFGQGLVDTASDFGFMGSLPTHPELLDWLAVELSRNRWSLKRMHKLLLASATYQQASSLAATAIAGGQNSDAWHRLLTADPANELLGRMRRGRLDGETIRDVLLWSGGRLNRHHGGPGVMPPLPAQLLATLLPGHWKESPDRLDHHRRSIYVFARRNLRYPLFDAFDRPDALASCPRRGRSTTAPQALVMLNSSFALESARGLAGYLLEQCGGSLDQAIELCHWRLLARGPTGVERDSARQFISSHALQLRDQARDPGSLALADPHPAALDPYQSAALVDYCLAMFNTNEFVYLD